jgi:hypothetical protein
MHDEWHESVGYIQTLRGGKFPEKSQELCGLDVVFSFWFGGTTSDQVEVSHVRKEK